jgi:hypothetical protein
MEKIILVIGIIAMSYLPVNLDLEILRKEWVFVEGTALTKEGFWWIDSVVLDLKDLSTSKTKSHKMYLQEIDGKYLIMSKESKAYYEILELKKQRMKLGLYVLDREKDKMYMKVIYELKPVQN